MLPQLNQQLAWKAEVRGQLAWKAEVRELWPYLRKAYGPLPGDNPEAMNVLTKLEDEGPWLVYPERIDLLSFCLREDGSVMFAEEPLRGLQVVYGPPRCVEAFKWPLPMDLHRKFSRVKPTQDKIARFAERYGLLGRGRYVVDTSTLQVQRDEQGRPRHIKGEFFYGESLSLWRREIHKMALLFRIFDYLRPATPPATPGKVRRILSRASGASGLMREKVLLQLIFSKGQRSASKPNIKKLKEHVVWGPGATVVFFLKGLSKELRARLVEETSVEGFRERLLNYSLHYDIEFTTLATRRTGPFPGWQRGDVVGPSSYYLASQIAEGQKGHVRMEPELSLGPECLWEGYSIKPDCLLGALYMMFGLELGGHQPMKSCRGCQSPFSPKHRLQQYCEEACRKRAFYHRKKLGTGCNQD